MNFFVEKVNRQKHENQKYPRPDGRGKVSIKSAYRYRAASSEVHQGTERIEVLFGYFSPQGALKP